MGPKKNKGCVITRTRADGSTAYQAQYKFPGGAFTSTHDDMESALAALASIIEDMEAQAEARERKRRKDMLAEAAMSPEGRQRAFLDMRIKDLLSGFKECSLASKRHKKAIPAMLDQVKDATVRAIKTSWVKSFVDGMREKTAKRRPYAYSTIVRQIAVLRHALAWKAEEMEAKNPGVPFSTKTMFPKNWEGKRRRRLARWEEIALIARLRAIKGPSRHQWRLLMRMALETGARLQELVGMLWTEIDRGHWSIPPEREKTAEGREVPLTVIARRCLHMLHLTRDPQSPRVFHLLGEPDSVSCLFRRYSKQARLEKFSFHCFRHEAITRMVIRSPDVFKIMKIVGHSSPEMLAHYTHLRNDELAKALAAQDTRYRLG